MPARRAATALWAGGIILAWAGVTLMAWRVPVTQALYPVLVALAVLVVSTWYGLVLCCASIGAVLAVPHPTRAETLVILVAIVALLPLALHTVRRERRERENIDHILSVVQRVSSSLDAAEVLSSIVATAREATGAKASSLRLLGSDQRTLLVRAADGLSRAYMDKGPVDVRRSAIDRRVLSGEIVQIRNAALDPLFQYPEQAREEGIVSVVCVPLRRNGHVMGVLRVYSGYPRRFGEHEVRVLTALAAQAVIALRHAELHESTVSFMRKVAHELRAPLGAVGTMLKVVLEGIPGSLTATQLEVLRRADQRTTLMLQEVGDLLSLSRTRLGKPLAAGETVALPERLQDVVALMQPQAEQAGVTLSTQVAPHLPVVPGSAAEIAELLTNLLSNAIKYTPAGGEVTAEVAPAEGGVAVRVTDTGIGIPEAEAPRLGEEFFRASNARQSGIAGTGLGLALVKAIAERHHAELRITSAEGKGTSVVVLFATKPAGPRTPSEVS